jgi:outer membrane protein assembly factor BamB
MRKSIVSLLALALSAPLVLAVQTSHWTHTSEADFKNGTFSNVVATNLGDLKLSHAIKTLLEQDSKVSAVYALVQAPDGTIYAGTGPQGIVLRLEGDKATELLKLDDGTSIFSLAIDSDGGLLIGTGGEKGRVLKLDKGASKPRELFSGEGVQYVWCMVRTDDGHIYAGTGPSGQLYDIKPDGGHELLLDTDENNLLSMVSDGKDLLYVGTDPNGLVYRINRKTKDVYILHDAPESEISALALDKDGNLYAGTAETVPQAGSTEPAGTSEQIGRPQSESNANPIPAPEHPAPPTPPELPKPNPGEPDPIPKKLMILPARPATTNSRRRQADSGSDADNSAATSQPSVTPSVNPPPNPRPGSESGQPREGGNAIYKIDKQGLVTEIFRQPVLVLSMIEQNGVLTVGTGSDGLIYQINPAADETLVLAKVEPKQVMALLPAKDGRIILGLANTGGLAAMTGGFASSGTYTSPVLDAQQVSRFGHVRMHGTLPKGATLKLSTRSGNISDPGEVGWSKWTEPVSATESMPVTAPSARFLQYRLSFASTDGSHTAIVDDVDVSYQEPNLSPQVKSVKITTLQKPPPDPNQPQSTPPSARYQQITWDASDPNQDNLIYDLFYRSGSKSPWIELKDNLKDTNYEWDTQTVADGRYEVKVVASDERANSPGAGKRASRISDPVQVDNTSPIIANLTAGSGAGEVRIQCEAYDQSSTLAAFAYVVDSSSDWQTVLPSDKIADSPQEKLDFSIAGLKPGPHQVTLRATDARGNNAISSVPVTIDAPAK